MIAFPATLDDATARDPAADRSLVPSLPALPDDTESLGDEIARLAAHLHAATYQLLVMIREFDERGGWGGGFLSCAHWLSWRTGIGPGPAREKVRVAKALASLPRISAAMARGEMSYSKVRALTRVASPENEADLLGVARHATAAHVEKLVRAWRYVDRLEEAEDEQRRHQNRFLRLSPDDDGTYVLRGRLDPEVGAVLEKALELASEALYQAAAGEGAATNEETEPSFEQRRADALGLLAERAMAKGEFEGQGEEREPGEGDSMREPSRPLGRADRFQVVLHVEGSVLRHGPTEGDAAGSTDSDAASPVGGDEPGPITGHAVLADSGSRVSAGTSRRLACDAGVVLMTHDEEGRVLDVGRKHRTVPPAIRRALDHRDKGCRFPGCGCRYTDAHHITHWADGGETKLDNLILLCGRHHRAVHEQGFRVEITEGGTVDGAETGTGTSTVGSTEGSPEVCPVRFFRPDGRAIPVVPEPPRLPAEPTTDLERAHKERGIIPHRWTATPLWNGEILDYGLAIDMLRPLKTPGGKGETSAEDTSKREPRGEETSRREALEETREEWRAV